MGKINDLYNDSKENENEILVIGDVPKIILNPQIFQDKIIKINIAQKIVIKPNGTGGVAG